MHRTIHVTADVDILVLLAETIQLRNDTDGNTHQLLQDVVDLDTPYPLVEQVVVASYPQSFDISVATLEASPQPYTSKASMSFTKHHGTS
jgi:hypothetical protein